MSDLGILVQVSADPSVVRGVARVLGFGGVSLLVAAVVAVVYRWYVREPVPRGLATLVSVGIVAVYLNTVGLFGQVVAPDPTVPGATLFETDDIVFNVASLGTAALASPLGRRVGDRLATNTVAAAGANRIDGDVSLFVRTVGRITPVKLPEEIDDIEGYDPVPDDLKQRLAGETLLFPRRLSGPELRDRLTHRITEDYGIAHVDLEVDEKGTVEYLALGSRATGLGPTMGPGTCAVPIRADPPNGASPGDIVQVWDGDHSEQPERVLTAELRAVVGDTVTLAVDRTEAAALDVRREYRLVTLPAQPQADRQFSSLLRRATETMGVVAIEPGSDLDGQTVGAVGATVVAVHTVEGGIDAIPSRNRALAGGETLYLVARPDTLRAVEARAGAPTASVTTDSAPPETDA